MCLGKSIERALMTKISQLLIIGVLKWFISGIVYLDSVSTYQFQSGSFGKLGRARYISTVEFKDG